MRLVFAGTPAFAVPALDALLDAGHDIAAVYTQPDRPAGRGRKLAASEIKQRAVERNLTIEQPGTLKSIDALERLKQYAPDAIIVVAYGLILPQAVLDIARLGCFNIHASLLPRWRGAAPIQQAIIAGDRSTGVSIMRMTAGLDCGPVVEQCELPIGATMSAGELHDALAAIGAALMVQSLRRIAEGSVTLREQDETLASYAPKIARSDARIRWSEPAETIERKLRAYDPWPGAETIWRNEPLKIWRASASALNSNAAPGDVLRADGEVIEVACGAGTLALQVLQLPGRKRVTAADFLHAHSLAGERLV